MQDYKREFIKFMVESEVLLFGEFTLSPTTPAIPDLGAPYMAFVYNALGTDYY